jgi:hypothetical protein
MPITPLDRASLIVDGLYNDDQFQTYDKIIPHSSMSDQQMCLGITTRRVQRKDFTKVKNNGYAERLHEIRMRLHNKLNGASHTLPTDRGRDTNLERNDEGLR